MRLDAEGPTDNFERFSFLPQALTSAEGSSFGHGWSKFIRTLPAGIEIGTFDPEVSEVAETDRVAELLQEMQHPLALQAPALGAWNSDWAHDERAWSAALEESRTRKANLSDAREKIARLEVAFLNHLRAERIASFARHRRGGAFEQLDAKLWNTENWETRFATGEINLSAPFDLDAADEAEHFIFVDRQELAEHYPSDSDRLDLAELWTQLSPKMQIAVRGAQWLADQTFEPSAEDFAKQLVAIGERHGVTLSHSLSKAFVTIMRSESAGKGGRRKKL